MARKKMDLDSARRPPDFVPFQSVKLVKTPPAGDRWHHEIKFDGYRLQARVVGGQATFHTRNGHDWTAYFPALAAAARSLPDCILDGELCAIGPNGYSDFSALRSALPSRTDDLVLFTFDIIWSAPDGGDLRPFPLEARKLVLRRVLDAADEAARRKYRYVDEFAGAKPRALFAAACELGFEGIVSKRRDRPYHSGKSDEWVKTKCRPGVEVVIGGWRTEGSRFNSLLAGVWDGGKLRYVGRIHAGYGDGVVADLVRRLAPLETPGHAFELGDPPKKTRDIHWVGPELVAEIELAEFTASGKIRQGAFKGLRLDKTAENLKAEERFG
jgi:bifunctional non-homologous end joining protein LigD